MHPYFARLLCAFVYASVIAGTMSQAAFASVQVDVEEACGAYRVQQLDFTAQAIVPAADKDTCRTDWFSPANPVGTRTTVELYYGQPGEVAELAKEKIEFKPDPRRGGFVAQRNFSKRELGSQTFVTVLVTSKKEVLQWTSWTIRDGTLPPDLPPAGNLSVDVRLTALHLSTSRGQFPRSRQAEGTVWKLADEEAVAYELDGEDTGSPGLHVSVSDAWTPSDLSPSSIKDRLVELLNDVADVRTHHVSFRGLEWSETSPEAIFYEDGTEKFERRHYYTVVTIWTDASYRPIGGRHPKRFAHETSASTWPAREVTE